MYIIRPTRCKYNTVFRVQKIKDVFLRGNEVSTDIFELQPKQGPKTKNKEQELTTMKHLLRIGLSSFQTGYTGKGDDGIFVSFTETSSSRHAGRRTAGGTTGSARQEMLPETRRR